MGDDRGDDGPVESAGPVVWLELPEGSPVAARLLAWVLEADGTWWAEVGLSLWARVETEGRLTAEPYAVRLTSPAHLITPVDGVDYRQVPRRRLPQQMRRYRSGRRKQPEAGTRWVEQQLPRGEHSDDPGRIIHSADCWAASDAADTVDAINAVEARGLLAAGLATVCPACDASRLLCP